MPVSPSLTTVELTDYQTIRDETERLAQRLSVEDQQVQSMADASPTKWHRAHATWFFETFLLLPHLPGYEPANQDYSYLYNSYYEAVGDRHPRAERGLVSRPSNDEVTAYRHHVDRHMDRLIGEVLPNQAELAELILLGLHHEQQHQELLLTDIKHMFSKNPLQPAYHRPPAPSTPAPTPTDAMGWIEYAGGTIEIGHLGAGFHFDNEGPRHAVILQPYRLADRLVTCGDWLDFMASDGYHQSEYWLSDGWATIAKQGWEAPMYWETSASGWNMHTLHGMQPINPNEPVCHISYYEADAYARWAGHRLATEAEWENAATKMVPAGNTSDAGWLHPRRVQEPAEGNPRQMFGDTWEWTSSSYAAYPRYAPAAGAVGEYNGKFMVNQYVLRGGSCVTPGGHIRSTYRNFFPAQTRWIFSGLRLASDSYP